MAIVKATRIGELLRELEEAIAPPELDGWIQELRSAEASARAAQQKIRSYQVNYRVKDENSKEKGSSGQRRERLVEMLRSLSPKEHHQGTSTWIFQLHIDKASTIANLFAPPLDTALDFLAVAELNTNRASVGKAKLKS